jgi:1,4-alpha-glucan branching enzyme
VLHPAWWWGAAAAAVLVVAVRPWSSRSSSTAVESVASASSAAVGSIVEPFGRVTPISGSDAIRFDITLPANANRVAIVGDFNGWDASATPMQSKREPASGRATWSAQVALAPGRHVYAFVIDGQRWLVDPLAPQVQDAGFGPSNAVIVDGGTQ